LHLTTLAQAIIEAILNGRQPEGLELPAFLKPIPAERGQRLHISGNTKFR
jgi:hypothetical protein